MDEFTTAFEITRAANDGAIYLVPLGIVLCIVGIVILKIRKKGPGRWLEKFLPPVFAVGFGLVLCVIALSDSDYRKMSDDLVTAYRVGRYDVEEGTIRVLREQPKAGHAEGDIVLLNEQRFEIDSFRRTPAYHRTISHGGVLKEGAYVRLYHVGGQILRIDVRMQPDSGPSEHSGVSFDSPTTENPMGLTWMDSMWIACITTALGLFLVRKIILFRYGYGIGLIDYGQDAKRLAAAANTRDPWIRMVFSIINILFPLLFLASLVGAIMARLVFPPS